MLTKLSRRIFQTVAYTDQFEYPLTSFQVWQRLVQEKASFSNVKLSLDELIKNGYLDSENETYFLANRQNTIAQRGVKERRAAEVFAVSKQLLTVVTFIPWISGVAVTGSVSMNVAEKNDDLDLMIITKPNTLWLSRLLLTMSASFFGRRRFWWEDKAWLKPSKSNGTKWCLNLWLTEDTMTVPKGKQSIYTAYEVCQAVFIYDKEHIAESFLDSNSWASEYLPHFYSWKKKNVGGNTQSHYLWFVTIIVIMVSPLVFILDSLLFVLQWFYMLGHMTIEKVSRSVAYFHPRPTSTFITDGWKKSISDTILLVKKTHTSNKVLLVNSANRSESFKMKKKAAAKKNDKVHQPSDSKASSKDTFELSEEVTASLAKARKRKQKIVLVTGVFDMIHIAHRQFLVQARIAGDFLIVGLESDKRVTELKGAGRPINNQKRRFSQMENLGVADAIFVLPENFANEEDHLAVLSVVKPDVLAASSHTPHLENKQKLLKKVGGKVKIVMQEDTSVSTTKLLKQMGKE